MINTPLHVWMMTPIQRIPALACSPFYCPIQGGLVKWRHRVLVLDHNSCHNSSSGGLPTLHSAGVSGLVLCLATSHRVSVLRQLWRSTGCAVIPPTHCFNNEPVEAFQNSSVSFIIHPLRAQSQHTSTPLERPDYVPLTNWQYFKDTVFLQYLPITSTPSII